MPSLVLGRSIKSEQGIDAFQNESVDWACS